MSITYVVSLKDRIAFQVYTIAKIIGLILGIMFLLPTSLTVFAILLIFGMLLTLSINFSKYDSFINEALTRVTPDEVQNYGHAMDRHRCKKMRLRASGWCLFGCVFSHSVALALRPYI